MVCFICTLILNAYNIFTRKVKWRKREILELAAFPVNENTNGFSERPKPVGKKDFKHNEILEFAHFLSKKLIAIPYIEKDQVVMTITKKYVPHLFNFKNSYNNETYVSFNFNGEISVNISKEDYQMYKDTLTFDKLCDSLGNLFKEFLEFFKKGESSSIIDRLNSLNLSPLEGTLLF